MIITWKSKITLPSSRKTEQRGLAETFYEIFPATERTQELQERLIREGFKAEMPPSYERGPNSIITVGNKEEAAKLTEFAIIYDKQGRPAATLDDLLHHDPRLLVLQLRGKNLLVSTYAWESRNTPPAEGQTEIDHVQLDGVMKWDARVERLTKGFLHVPPQPHLYEGSVVRALGLQPRLEDNSAKQEIVYGSLNRVFGQRFGYASPVDPRMAKHD